METLYDALRASHRRQRSLCRSLTRTSKERRLSVQKALRCELSAHASAEERFLYAVILMDDSGLSSSRHALAEHHEVEELADDLKSLDPAGSAWAEKARELSRKVHHHLREEEGTFFQFSGKLLTQTQKTSLAKSYRRDYERLLKKFSDSE